MTLQDQSELNGAPRGDMAFAVEPWRQARVLGEPGGWDALGATAAMPNPFFERWALLPALEQFAGHDDVCLAQLYCGDTLVGLAPVFASHDYYGRPIPHLAIWLHQNAFFGTPLVAPGHELAFWHELFAWADRHRRLAPFLTLPQQAGDGPVVAALRDVLALDGRSATIPMREERAMLSSTLSADDYYIQSMTKKRRKELRRLHTRLSEQGAFAFHRHRGSEAIEEWVDAFLFLEKAGWKGRQGTSLADGADTATFFRDALRGAASAGRLERLSFTIDGRPVAMLANFLTPPGAFSFKTTFDEDFARFSPGLLLQIDNLALLDDGVTEWADSCAAADHPMIERIWREKREILGVNVALGGPLRRAAMKFLARLETGSFPKGI